MMTPAHCTFPAGFRFALSLTFDLEMCSNFPYWSSVWDHRKGALDDDTKRYVLKLADLARDAGVKFQWFLVGSGLEDADLGHLRRLVADGHAIGSHTYRHVNVKAQTIAQLQVVYQQDPSLAAGLTPTEAIRNELQMTTLQMKQRLGIAPRGFRTPGGFGNGLADVPAVQKLLLDEGFAYASSHYNFPARPELWQQAREAMTSRNPKPSLEGAELQRAQRASIESLQPYRYPGGLLELPMMGLSDVQSFRNYDLERETWLRLLEHGVEVAHERKLVLSVLLHPCVLAVRDPHAAAVRRLIARAQSLHGWIATNDEIAARCT